MKRFMKLYAVEQKMALRSADSMIFGVAMPVGILILIAAIAGGKTAGDGGYTYMQSAFASLIAVGICATAFMGLPLVAAEYRDKKILKHFFVTPCSPAWILTATALSCMMNAVLSAIAVSLTAIVGFGYRMEGSIPGFVGAWLLTMLSMFSIGLLMASLCRRVKTTNAVTSLVYFPMLFLSRATIPYELFPEGLQRVADFLPLTQGIKLMKAVSMGESLDSVLKIIILLATVTVVCTAVSVKTFRWE